MYRHMLPTRPIDERGNRLFKAGKLPGSFYTWRGNEAASVGVGAAMADGDVACPLHRNLGVHITRGVEPGGHFCQFMGRADGRHRGRDSNLRTHDSRPGAGLIAGVSPPSGIITAAVGIALAFSCATRTAVALGWCGDGASSRGDTHEAMNFAGVRRLPHGVRHRQQPVRLLDAHRALNFACENLADRGPALRLRGRRRRRHRPDHRVPRGARAVEKARTGGGPTLLELVTLRMEGHAVHDDAAYVPRDLLEEYSEKDPLARFRAWLELNEEFTDDEHAALDSEVRAIIDAGVAEADASPQPDPATLLDGVYAESN